jgi:O-acetyl-ADP-ribose deacetylase (regulator of RNase III)
MANLRIIFVDPNPNFKAAIDEFFKDVPNIQTVVGKFQQIPDFDCMVSPANSFGLMDGGVDADIIGYFGYPLMERVQNRILADYLGEQPVGTCIIVETGHPQHPYLAHTPTMRVPMTIAHTDNVYKAMWALLLAVRQHNRTAARKIESIVCPGLGTGTGQVPYRQAAWQMSIAYRHYLNPPAHLDWRYAEYVHSQVRYGGDDGLHFPPEWA